MSTILIHSVLQKIRDLPPLPDAVCKLYSLSSNLDTDIQELIQTIAADEALSVKILRLANSAFYGFAHQVTTISQAVTLIGFYGIRDLALSLSIPEALPHNAEQPLFSRREFWKHSLAVAIASRLLAVQIAYKNPEEAFTAGLLHDLGRLILLEYCAPDYMQVLAKFEASPELSLQAVERQFLGIDHAEVGRMLCQHWKISGLLGQVVSEHHGAPTSSRSEDDQAVLIHIVHLADNLAKLSQLGFSGSDRIATGFLWMTQVSPAKIREILFRLPEEVNRIENFLGLPCSGLSEHASSPRPDPFCILLKDTQLSAIIGMLLDSLGYSSSTVIPDRLPTAPIAGIIGDTASSTKLAAFCNQRRIPFLNLEGWGDENRLQLRCLVPVRQLQAYLDTCLLTERRPS